MSFYPPAIDDGHIAFRADYEDSQGPLPGVGIIAIAPDNTLAVLADVSTPVPGTTGTF